MEWVASTLQTTSEHGVSSITTADAHTSGCQQSTELTPHADLNGIVRFAERRNLVLLVCRHISTDLYRQMISYGATINDDMVPNTELRAL